MKKKVQVALTAVMGVFLGMGLTVGLGVYKVSQAAPNYEYLDLFTKVLHFVQTNYVEEVDTKKLIEGAIKGMLATLDPHTVYLPPDLFKEMQVDTQGKFGGLGIEINIADGYLTVVTPIEDTPAFNAGVEPGDRIMITKHAHGVNFVHNDASDWWARIIGRLRWADTPRLSSGT